MITSLVPERYG